MKKSIINESLKRIAAKAKIIKESTDKLAASTAEYMNSNFPNVFQRFGSEFVMNAIRKEINSSQSTNPEVLANAVFKTISAGVQEAKQSTNDVIPADKPRNFVAKNALGGGAGAHKDKKREFKKGNFKHKKKELDIYEVSTSKAQANFMAAAAHNKKFAKKAGINQSVAKEFNKADKGRDLEKLPAHVTENSQHEAHTLAIKKLRRALMNPNVPPEVRRRIEDHLKYEVEQAKKSQVAEGLGTAIFGADAVAHYEKAMGWMRDKEEGSMTVDDIKARNQYRKEFVSKVAGALSSAIKARAVIKTMPQQAAPQQEPANTAGQNAFAQMSKSLEKSGEKNPNIITGYNEAFDKFDRLNALFENILNEAGPQTIKDYIKSVVMYYARSQGVTGLGAFEPTVDAIANDIDKSYPSKDLHTKLEALADVVFSLGQSDMQHQGSGFNPEMGPKGDQILKLVQSMSTAADADDLEAIARQALIKLARVNPQEYSALMSELRKLGSNRLRN